MKKLEYIYSIVQNMSWGDCEQKFEAMRSKWIDGREDDAPALRLGKFGSRELAYAACLKNSQRAVALAENTRRAIPAITLPERCR